MSITLEEAVALASLLGAVGSAVVALWRIFKAITRAEQRQHELKESVETIKKEVTCNGGGSIKDLVLKLDKTCDRMETRQKVIDQRSKAALHYQDRCLFETDRKGNLIWANEAFYQKTVDCGDISGGLDWITLIHEDEREEFLKELNSCLAMSRRLDVEVTCSLGKSTIHFTGYPYRVGQGCHEGFLIHLNKRET
jgi:hypothetical protein